MSAPVFPPQHIVMFGRPGSGKSSLAERLNAEHGYTVIRTGELLRAAIRRGDPLGRRVEKHVSRGGLVPDALIFELLEQSLSAPGEARWLFDGFPRTMGQVPLLEQFETKLQFQIGCYLEIVVSRDEAVRRMTGRRICPQCGATYHLQAHPPQQDELCDHDGAPLQRRRDDAMSVVEVRQQLYDEHAGPILEYYRAHARDRYRQVNGEQGLDAVYDETCQVLQLAMEGA